MVTTNATPCCTPGTSSTQVSSVITITGLGDHDQPDWLITMTGIRTKIFFSLTKDVLSQSRTTQQPEWRLVSIPVKR